MDFILDLKKKVINGYGVTKKDAMELIKGDFQTLTSSAKEIQNFYCGDSFDFCTIVNGKSGKCSEDCKYCAQSSFYKTKVEEYPLLNTEALKENAIKNAHLGILRYSVVTSGRNLSDQEINILCKGYKEISNSVNIQLCASHGLLELKQFEKLKDSGVSRYHNNLETSSRMFPSICTTHTYDEKINAIKMAKEAGLEVCSGGIIGLGETMEDRIDMALELRELGVTSVPINILNPIPGTPFENIPPLSIKEIAKTIAVYRFILPEKAIRLAGGRGLLSDKGKLAFQSGSNAAISGDMLTTSGIDISEDFKIITDLGFKVRPL